ncbi:MAG: (2Fe-2S)-binding protein [Oleibacter sp.]|nr:(2Fe-2S)-binding protein [Thalassolituus sp.]
MKFQLNGKQTEFNGDPSTPLLWVIRDEKKLTGTKYGCGIAQCGACTVHLNGSTLRSCVTPISEVSGKEVTTIEGLLSSKVSAEATAVQRAWVAIDVPQCGYCQSGQVMSAVALLKANSNPTDQDIDNAMAGNICRCATYQRIRQGIHDAAGTLTASASSNVKGETA